MIRARAIGLNLAMALFALMTLAPLAWMVAVSLMPTGAAETLPPPLWPDRPTLFQYRKLLTDYHIIRPILNSALLATLSTVLGLALTLPAGYAFAKLRFRGRARLLRLLMLTLVVPGQVAMLPLFLMLREAHLVDSYAGALLPSLATPLNILFVRQAVLQMPDAMLDAARVDGAGELMIFWRVVVPLLRPAIITLSVLIFLGNWEDFLWPLIILADQHRYTLPVALAAMSREHVQDGELMMAGAVVTIAPVLLLFLCFQRYYLSGVLGGSLKE